MGEDYKQARKWADRFVDSQCRQLATLLNVPREKIVIADDQTDCDGTDVLVGPLRIALRVRRYSYLERYGLQPTIRTSKGRGGTPSELDKLRQGRNHYMLLNYATPNASSLDNDDDSLTASVLLDLQPVTAAAQDDFAGVTVTEIEADRVHALAIDLASLMARHGPCVVHRQVTTTTTTTTQPTTAFNATTGLHHATTETGIVQRSTEAHNPKLLGLARKRARPATRACFHR